jgi:hypothetical protein
LNKAVFGVGLYAKAEERIPETNVFQSALRAGGNAALALTNATTVGAVGVAANMVRGSTSRGQPAQLALQNWNAPGVAAMFPQAQIMMTPLQLAYQSFAQPMQVMTYPYGVNPAALPPSSSYAALPPSSSYDFNEYPTEARYSLADHDMPTVA